MPRKRLVDCLAGCSTIATVGLCKNAGKTTVLSYLLDYYHSDLAVGITSIGYDGEETDAVTLLPKPRITVHPGMLVATSQDCLRKTGAGYELLHNTGVSTNLGEVVIIRALSTGYMEVAGPSIASQVKQISDLMLHLGCQKVLVDGAAGRLSFAIHTDCAMLSVGAAMSAEMRQVVRQASHTARLLSLAMGPRLAERCPADEVFTVRVIEGVPHYIFRGVMADRDLEAIIAQSGSNRKVALVNDATAIFISPQTYSRFTRRGGSIQVRNQVNLVALTINPMSPYGPWFDENEFLQVMQLASPLPVYNIMYEKVSRHDE